MGDRPHFIAIAIMPSSSPSCCRHSHKTVIVASAVLSVLAFAVSSVSALAWPTYVETTIGAHVPGFSYVGTNVIAYSNMTLDACDIQAALGDDVGQAMEVFFNGKNSPGKTFERWAISNHSGEMFFDMFTTGMDKLTLVNAFEVAANEGNSVGAMAAVDLVRILYMMHEVDATRTKTMAGNSDPMTGGAHNLDEAVAIWWGSAVPSACRSSLPAIAADQALLMVRGGLDGDSIQNLALSRAFSDLQIAALTNNTEMAHHAYDGILHQLRSFLLQRVHAMSYATMLMQQCGKDNADPVSSVATTMLGLSSLLKPVISEKTLAALMKATTPDHTYNQVANAIMDVAKEIRLPLWQLGTPDKARFVKAFGLTC